MNDKFQKLKAEREKRFKSLRALIRPNAGEHRETKLKRAGCGSSGSIVHATVSREHADLLYQDFRSQFARSGVDRKDLRLLTILHGVSPLDKTAAIRSAAELEAHMRCSFSETGIRCLGAVEMEIVRLELLRGLADAGDDSLRKLNVLEQLSEMSFDTAVLVHFHGVLDLSNSTLQDPELKVRLLSIPSWSRAPYQIEVKSFFSDKPVEASLRDIASYLVKGGNDRLEYNVGFGRLPEYELDAQMWRQGLGRADRGGETLMNERSLTLSEIAFLDQLWISLMMRRPDNRGYLIEI